MFVRDGAVTPGPSRECDITFFGKGRPKSARQSRDSTVAVRRVQSVTVPSSRVSRECRSPGLRSPPLRMPEVKQTPPNRISKSWGLGGGPNLAANFALQNPQMNPLQKFKQKLSAERSENKICFLASSNMLARPAPCSVD